MIQLAGCRIGVSDAASSNGARVLSIDHSERGSRRLQCPSADSCREWLSVLRGAAAVNDDSLSPPEISSSEDPGDARGRLTATLVGLRAHGLYNADVDSDVMQTGGRPLPQLETLQARSERDEAKKESTVLSERVLILSRDKNSSAEARVGASMHSSGAAEDAIAALEHERREVVRLGEERQVQPISAALRCRFFAMYLPFAYGMMTLHVFAGASAPSVQISIVHSRSGG